MQRDRHPGRNAAAVASSPGMPETDQGPAGEHAPGGLSVGRSTLTYSMRTIRHARLYQLIMLVFEEKSRSMGFETLVGDGGDRSCCGIAADGGDLRTSPWDVGALLTHLGPLG